MDIDLGPIQDLLDLLEEVFDGHKLVNGHTPSARMVFFGGGSGRIELIAPETRVVLTKWSGNRREDMQVALGRLSDKLEKV